MNIKIIKKYSQSPTVLLILITLFIKLVLFAVGAVAVSSLPFSTASYTNNFHYPQKENSNILPFKTWDAQHYLFLSEVGYKKGNESNRFFPLYPALISMVSFIVRNSLISAYLLSTGFSIGCVVLLYKLTLKIAGNEDAARYAVLYLMTFPSAFFLSLPYSESLFIFLALLFFYLLEKEKLYFALLPAFLLPLARPTGIFIAIPLFVFLYLVKKKNKKISLPTFNKPISVVLPFHFVFAFVPMLGLLSYFCINYIFLHDFFAGIRGINSISTWNVTNLIDPGNFLKELLRPNLIIHGFQNSLIDRIFFILFVVSLPWVYRNVPRHYFFYALCIGMVPFLGSFTSYTRYVLPAFPLFITMAILLTGAKKALIRYSLLFLCISFQIMFFIMHVLNYWVA